ncbi:MAG: aldo/keto reductase [Pseudomonadales bacterium]|nr:aldo/keto reductase [Pseudomonadales bacterium]
MKIALGTVQFGLEYGVANAQGRVSRETAQEILDVARDLGVDILDTAAAYGNSEQVLGRAGIGDFKVVSKVPPGEVYAQAPRQWIENCIHQSLENLECNSLYGLLLHRPLELLEPNGERLYAALLSAKQKGLVEKIGVSVYGPEDLEKLNHFHFDLVQAPMNILDRRLKNSGWLERLSLRGTEVHIRSAFLQGLLLMPDKRRPEYFAPWGALLSEYDTWRKTKGLTPVQACLGYLSSHPEIDRIVVGVDAPAQLKEIVAAVGTCLPSLPEALQTSDPGLINPALWKL